MRGGGSGCGGYPVIRPRSKSLWRFQALEFNSWALYAWDSSGELLCWRRLFLSKGSS